MPGARFIQKKQLPEAAGEKSMFLKLHLFLSTIERRRRIVCGSPHTPKGKENQVKHALHAAARRSSRPGIRYKESVSSWPF
jgi:hypothetical protein